MVGRLVGWFLLIVSLVSDQNKFFPIFRQQFFIYDMDDFTRQFYR